MNSNNLDHLISSYIDHFERIKGARTKSWTFNHFSHN